VLGVPVALDRRKARSVASAPKGGPRRPQASNPPGRVSRSGGRAKRLADAPRGATQRSKLDCAGPAANNSGLKSDRTPTREQRGEVTHSEATESTAGPVALRGGLRREGYGSRPYKRAGERGEDRQVGVQCDPIQPLVRSESDPRSGCGRRERSLGVLGLEDPGYRAVHTDRSGGRFETLDPHVTELVADELGRELS
jgi:hypothetical protein